MIASYQHRQFDLSKPIEISIPLQEGPQVNCYYAPPFSTVAVEMGSFIGDVSRGGAVNYKNVFLNPHGNGTHTECYAHIAFTDLTMADALERFHFTAQVISVTPMPISGAGSVIRAEAFNVLEPGIEAVVIRTLPNENAKRTRQYSNTHPPYLEAEAALLLREKGVRHLLIDLPSIDPEVDGGALAAHRAFWRFPENPIPEATITELIFVPDQAADGIYLLNLQVAAFRMDAAPSRPVLYPQVKHA